MTNWYWLDKGVRQGPVSSKELRDLAAQKRITPETPIQKDGATDWVRASQVKGLFSETKKADDRAEPLSADNPTADGSVFGAARKRASFLMRDLRTLNWREEIVPIDETNFSAIFCDYVFWTVLLAGVLPQLIGTVNDVRAQLSLYALLFAGVWGVVFRDFIVRYPAPWRWLIASAGFTAVIGTSFVLYLGRLLPASYVRMPNSSSILISLFGFVAQTGLVEELCKAIPTLFYLLYKRRNAEPLTAVLVGVFSGLGFAAAENLLYGESTAQLVAMAGVFHVLLRLLSTVLGHAVLSGIVAYFLVMAFLTQRRAPALAFAGFGLAAVLHGCYDWLQRLQPTFAALVDIAAFTLFYAYTVKLRVLIENRGGVAATQNGVAVNSNRAPDSDNAQAQQVPAGI